MAINYVKFQRGTQSAYNSIKLAGRLDPNTLYFIYNNIEDADAGGLLYLGERLIGGTGSTMGASILNDLTDVNIGGTPLADGMILQYVNSSQKWEPVSIKTAISESGALATISSITKQEGQTDNQALATVTTPTEGDIVFVNGVPYIYDGTNWNCLSGDVSALNTRVETLETQMEAVDGKISSAILAANHLTYQVAPSLPTITESNVGDLENIIMLVPNENAEPNSGDLYDEFMVINGSFEKIGSWGVNLNNYATTATVNALDTRVGALETNVNNLSTVVGSLDSTYVQLSVYNQQVGDIQDLLENSEKESTTIVEEIIELQNAVKWTDID